MRREIEQLDRRIKTTVALIAHPAFEGLDEIRSVLADLKRKRDSPVNQQKDQLTTARSMPTQQQLREWANQQLSRLEEIAAKTEITLIDRQLIEEFVQRIEVDSNSNTGTIHFVCRFRNSVRLHTGRRRR